MTQRRNPAVYLADIQLGCEHAIAYTIGVAFTEYLSDSMRRSAVERQFQIIGEAIRRIQRVDPVLSQRIPASDAIVGMRSVLVHHYDVVDSDRVWQTVKVDIPALLSKAETLLDELVPEWRELKAEREALNSDTPEDLPDDKADEDA